MTEIKEKKSGSEFEVPEGWKLNAIGEMFHLKNGINAGKESYGEGVKFINVMEVINKESLNETLIPGSVKISDDQKATYLVKFGDVLFNRTSEISDEVGLSTVYLGKEPVVFGGFVIRATEKNKWLDDFFKKYCFRSNLVRNQVIKGGQGAVRSNIGQGDLEKVMVPIPPLPEQRAIAQVLGTMDEAIKTTEHLITQKELRKKWLMQNLLTGKKRLKGFSGEWKKLGAGEIFKSVSKKGFSDEELLSATQDRGMIPRTMLEGRVSMPTTGTEGFKLVEIGDFVISLRSFQGGLEYSSYKGLVSPAYTVLQPKKSINELFYKQYFKSSEFIGRLATAVIGIRDGKQISYSDFCIVKVPYPSIEEQTAISWVLQTADHEINLLKEKVEKLREQKKGMMQRLLTGKVRVTNKK